MKVLNWLSKRRSKIENAEIIIPAKITKEEAQEKQIEVVEKETVVEVEGDDAIQEEEEIVYEGYANVIPIRGKDSTLDYYLMVLSKELFT